MDNSNGNIKDFLLDLFFPAFCFGCGKEGCYVCPDCKATLDICQYRYCLCETNPSLIANNASYGKCAKCRTKSLAGLFFALPYKERELTKKLVHSFKYEPFVKDLAKTLAQILCDHFALLDIPTDFFVNSILVPVPSDIKKLRSRGYNQSEELAKELAKMINVPMAPDLLKKIRHTAPQAESSKTQRQQNLKGAFSLNQKMWETRSPTIFLVDDVYTTGCTMEECARVLLASGAPKVWGISFAREG